MLSIEEKTSLEEFLSIPYVEISNKSPESISASKACKDIGQFSLKAGEHVRSDLLESLQDIKIEGFSISIQGRYLFHNTDLKLKNGRRYGLVG